MKTLYLRIQAAAWILALIPVTALFAQPTGSGTVHQSIPSRQFGLSGNVVLSQQERDRITREFIASLQRVNADAHEAADPGFFGSVVDFAGGVVNRMADKAIDALPLTGVGGFVASSVLGEAKDRAVEFLFEDDSEDFKLQRAFAVRREMEKALTQGVNSCTGDLECIDRLANTLIEDPDVQSQFKEAGDLGLYDDATTRALIKSVKDDAIAQYKGTVIKIDNLDLKITGIVNDVRNTMVTGFQTINQNQRTIIKGVATLIDIEQRQTIALQNIQTTLNENFKQISVGINNVIELQQVNLFISAATLEAVGVVNQKVDVLNENVTIVSHQITSLASTINEMQVEQRNEKIQQIFNNSSLGIKITELENVNSSISQLLLKQENGERRRQELIANFKTLKDKENVIIATKMIATWGNVGKEALSVFCSGCPEELAQGIDAAIVAANIVGNITSGNLAGAAMNVIGIFKKPEPSPELKMLQQISRQLTALESKMNAQFREVHNHLFAIEQNLGTRMQIVDFKVEQLTQFVLAAHVQVMEQLSGIDSKLNYVINQNECTKDLILKLTQQGGQDLCKGPVSEFKTRAFEGRIVTFQDLDNFFRGNFCQPCIQALFDASSVVLPDNASFRYAQCNIEGADNKARPDRVYEFMFQQFIRDRATDTVFVNSLLLIPVDVRVAAAFPDSVGRFLNRSVLALNQEDRNFRNHRAIMAYADYLLTMFTMTEFFDNNRLLTPAEINENPGFSRERARKMIIMLEGAQDLLNHAMFQQSILAGNGAFARLDEMIRRGSAAVAQNDVAAINLADIFYYNPYLSKNYAAYLIDRHVGLDRLKDIVDNKRLKKGKQRIVLEGFSILLFDDANGKPAFNISLTDRRDPNKHVPLLQGFLPVEEEKVDSAMYARNLIFVFPAAYSELQSMREGIVAKLAEMNLIVSPQLDVAGSKFSRDDLERLIASAKGL
jgi:hypothetical protein